MRSSTIGLFVIAIVGIAVFILVVLDLIPAGLCPLAMLLLGTAFIVNIAAR